jgi:hypothetical protein
MAEQLADLVAATLDGLQKDATTVAKNAGDTATGIGLARLQEDALDRFFTSINGTTGVEQTDEHGESPVSKIDGKGLFFGKQG